MPIVKKLGVEVSNAYFGYIGECGVIPLDKDVKDTDHVYVVCDIDKFDLKKINGSDYDPKCFDFYLGPKDGNDGPRSATFYWRDLMANLIGNETIWLVTDNMKDVFLLHSWREITYFLGKVKDDNPLRDACLWRYKRMQM